MFPEIKSKATIATPAIYYVVKGRLSYATEKREIVAFEEKFVHENPIIAREQAFSFYQNYVTILEEHKQLFQKSLECPYMISNENFGGLAIEKYSISEVTYTHPKSFDKGISLHMVINQPINYGHKTDQKGDRFLIHGIWNFDKTDITNLTSGLIREFGYYTKLKYETFVYQDIVDFSKLDIQRFKFAKPRLHTILSTPFNWNFNYYLNHNNEAFQKSKRLEGIANRIKKGDLINNEYIAAINIREIVISIASLLNERGGYLFVGINKYRQSKNVFEHTKISDFKREIQMILRTELKEIVKDIKLSLYKVGPNIVFVFEVPKSPQKGIFIKENHDKVFYRRNSTGIYKYNDPEEIVNYCIKRNTNIKTIQDILDQL